jgi:6-phosphogluconolactonase
MSPEVIISKDEAEVAQRAARALVERAQAAIETRGRFVLGLAGGSTPKRTYEVLASEHKDSAIWPKVVFTLGDERCVHTGHQHSNQKMCWDSLLTKIGATKAQFLEPIGPEIKEEVRDEATHRRLAEEYDRRLTSTLGFGSAHDVLLLGMGPDGHTLSLFPPAQEASVIEPLYIPVLAPPTSPIERRVTLSYGAARAAREVWLLTTGESKAEVLFRVLAGDDQLPTSKVIRDRGGRVRLWIDQAAAARLSRR